MSDTPLRGPYRMAELKGYNRYYRFVTAEYDLRRNPATGKQWARDASLPPEYTAQKRYAEYQEELLALLSYDAAYDRATPFDLLEQARELKRRYFADWWNAALNASLSNLSLPAFRLSAPEDWPPWIDEHLRAAVGGGTLRQYGLDGWRKVLDTCDRIMFVPDSRETFLRDLAIWILPFSQTHDVYIVVKADESPFTVSETFARNALAALALPDLPARFLSDRDTSIGISSAIIRQMLAAHNAAIVAPGIWNYFSLFRSGQSFVFSLDNTEDIARGILQTAYNPSQPGSLTTIVGYQTQRFPDGISLTGQDVTALSLEEFLTGRSPRLVDSLLREKQEVIQRFSFLASMHAPEGTARANGPFARAQVEHTNIRACKRTVCEYIRDSVMRLDSGFFRIVRQENTAAVIKRVNGPGSDHAFVQAVSFAPADFTIVPARFGQLTDLSLAHFPEPVLLSNFSYFFTENLRNAYNDRVPTEEQLTLRNIPFDYQREIRDGATNETVPLYQKGYFGAYADGSLLIDYLQTAEIACAIRSVTQLIPSSSINPAEPDALPFCLFTPAYQQERVGRGCVNLVIVNNTLLHISRQNDVAVPPIGVVLSLDAATFQRLYPTAQSGDTVHWRIRFQEEDSHHLSDVQWLYGGYNLLILNGHNLVETPQQCERTLRKEGWFSPQSMRTQETQLQDGQRHPRLLLGTTRKGNTMLVAISGRTTMSRGATHTESALYCRHLTPPDDELLNLINLDGGGSVFLEAREAGRRVTLNFPAPTDLNPAGIVRPNSAVLTVRPATFPA